MQKIRFEVRDPTLGVLVFGKLGGIIFDSMLSVGTGISLLEICNRWRERKEFNDGTGINSNFRA